MKHIHDIDDVVDDDDDGDDNDGVVDDGDVVADDNDDDDDVVVYEAVAGTAIEFLRLRQRLAAGAPIAIDALGFLTVRPLLVI